MLRNISYERYNVSAARATAALRRDRTAIDDPAAAIRHRG